jgi:hypothetical protein
VPIADRLVDEERSARYLIARILRHGMELGAIEQLDIESCAGLLFAILHSIADEITRGGDREKLVGAIRNWSADASGVAPGLEVGCSALGRRIGRGLNDHRISSVSNLS